MGPDAGPNINSNLIGWRARTYYSEQDRLSVFGTEQRKLDETLDQKLNIFRR
jgi:hypothetical protein